jgi:hypothetical protein
VREIYEAKVIEVNFNELNQKGLQTIGQELENDNPDHRIAFYSTEADKMLFVLVPNDLSGS